eukprot:jgi/Chrzof1/308/Cz01g10210.t1
MVATRRSSAQPDPDQHAALGANGTTGEDKFHKGVAISMWQNSGDEHSNWTNFVRSKFPFNRLPFGLNRYSGKYGIHHNNPNTWDRYREEIELAHKIGCNSFRLSIEWSRIEPKRGQIDQKAVERYHHILDCMAEFNIIPNATCHHFTHPQWFDDMGGFEKEENIPIFVDWCVRAVELFGKRIHFWATFNEPTCATFLGWITGMHPPGKTLNVVTAGRVLINKLKAHTEAYHAIKATPVGAGVVVGLVHHHITFMATGPSILSALAKYAAEWMQYWWGYELVHKWMKTGHIEWHVPVFGKWLEWQCPGGKPPCDWFGVNYYSRAVVTWYMKPWCLPGEIMTDMYYPIYAEGLYKSLMQAAEYNIPIYITETGIADKSDANRAHMIDSYMQAALRAMKDGADVRGVYYWTLLDNFEWNAGYLMEFGLYGWRPDGSVDRKLKAGAKMLVRYFKTLPDDLAEVRKVVSTMPFAPDEEYEEEEQEALLATQAAMKKKHRTLVAAT